MIVRMKKVTLLCLAGDTDTTLTHLRNLGVMHLEPRQAPSSSDYAGVDSERDRLTQLMGALRPFMPVKVAPIQGGPAPAELANRVDALLAQRRELEEQGLELERERGAAEPFGSFDPALLDELKAKGVFVKLCYVPLSFEGALPVDGQIHTLSEEAGGRYVAIISTKELTLELPACPVPSRSLDAIRQQIGKNRSATEKTDAALRELAASSAVLSQHRQELDAQAEFLAARDGMGDSGQVAYLQGYCPEDTIGPLQQQADRHGWGLLVEDPAASDAVPTLVRYPAWVKVMRPVFAFLGITPGYNEADISPTFFVFLSIFFGMIVGDAGYGLLFLILLPYFRRKKFRDAAPEPFRLLYIFSTCTVIWGVLTGSYFGLDYTLLPAFMQHLRVDWLANQNNSMTFSLLLGAIHLTIAHGWKGLTYGRDARAMIQFGWVGVVWGVFALARNLLVQAPFPIWLTPLPVGGILAILLGLILTKEWMGLGLLALNLVSCFGDLMSYLRLFALGIASVKVADAFNGMAGDLGYGLVAGADGATLIVMTLVAAVAMTAVLVIGHGLNIILCAMSVLVHGVRLNALEFSLHMGLEWSGFAYRPFADRIAPAPSTT